ncbi:hypothetical protein INH39_28900 [Massilia violaceinigra]|uniref:Immunity protein 35 domain-containing protein n=1 Tax=Massilia violaceinigra TaxID=2045208 RepID=A0ABY4A3N2_9BURK|nr:hypothetical protein [Massilia violaceinigra]UOD29380.1 hypothetical protein INH39_28900 [Massilia violaceinigra]
MLISKKSISEMLRVNSKIVWDHYAKDGAAFNWVPLLTLGGFSGNSLGLADDGSWVYGTSKGIRRLDSVDNCFFILPALIYERKEFICELQRSFDRLSIQNVLIKTFPFDSMILSAIQEGAQFLNDAMRWIDGGYPMSDGICSALLARNLNFSCIRKYEEDRMKSILDVGKLLTAP